MSKKPKPITNASQFINELNSIGCGLGYDCRRVFGDWLQMIFSRLHAGQDEESYFKAIKPYQEKNLELLNRLAQLFGQLVKAMEGGVDVLGQIFEEGVTFCAYGQFFTPQPVADMMAKMTDRPVTPQNRPGLVNDPACGSGRQLLAFAKHVTTDCIVVEQDIDETCCMMTAINLGLNGLCGYVICGNSLSSGAEMYRKVWRVSLPAVPGVIIPVSLGCFLHAMEVAANRSGEAETPVITEQNEPVQVNDNRSNLNSEENPQPQIITLRQPTLFDMAG
jgi:hypothetical protein